MKERDHQEITATTLRAPVAVMQAITQTAKKNQRSMNSEIVFRLQKSLEREQSAA